MLIPDEMEQVKEMLKKGLKIEISGEQDDGNTSNLVLSVKLLLNGDKISEDSMIVPHVMSG